jgi:hypothetical protein
MNVLVERILPILSVVVILVFVAVLKKIAHPSPLVWGRIFSGLGPLRAHEVLDYNKQNKEPRRGRLEREVRRRNFAVNWGFLRAGVKNTVLFHRALLFEKDTIDARKPGSEYELSELATLELLDEAIELRWAQVRCQIMLQLRAKLGLQIDKEIFVSLFLSYKLLEEHMIELAGTKGQWLQDMMRERLGLTEWGVIEGGRSDPNPA